MPRKLSSIDVVTSGIFIELHLNIFLRGVYFVSLYGAIMIYNVSVYGVNTMT